MKKILFLLVLALGFVSCSQDENFEQTPPLTTRSSSSFSLFQDVNTYAQSINGQIYCPYEATYTFTFTFVGSPGSRYFVGMSGANNLTPSNGSSHRTVTATLKPGFNYFDVSVSFSGEGQRAEARLVIDKINGSPIYNEEGYVDLAISAFSQIHNPGGPGGGGSEPYHWTCPNCNTINSTTVDYCVGCGRHK
ncbi:hypothetical protein [Bacteroides sp.]